MRFEKAKLMSMTPGTIANAIKARRQLSVSNSPMATNSLITEMTGDMKANCSRPVVVSTSPVSRERMPPVFMSQSFGSGRWSNRSNNERRNESMTFTLTRRCR